MWIIKQPYHHCESLTMKRIINKETSRQKSQHRRKRCTNNRMRKQNSRVQNGKWRTKREALWVAAMGRGRQHVKGFVAREDYSRNILQESDSVVGIQW